MPVDTTTLVSIIAFVLILALLVFLRATSRRFEIKATDIVVAVLPVLIFLLVTGKIQKFEVGELKIETAFVNASASAIASQVSAVSELPAEPVETAAKGGLREIPRLIAEKSEGLRFRLGHGGYWGPAIEEYLVKLTRYPFLRYVIIDNSDGTFFGIADAREITALLTSRGAPHDSGDFARWLNASDIRALRQISGLLRVEDALTEVADKREALQQMERLDADILPVVDAERRFVGVVDRSRLTASLIIDVAQQLK